MPSKLDTRLKHLENAVAAREAEGRSTGWENYDKWAAHYVAGEPTPKPLSRKMRAAPQPGLAMYLSELHRRRAARAAAPVARLPPVLGA